jgi:hypothetical protein
LEPHRILGVSVGDNVGNEHTSQVCVGQAIGLQERIIPATQSSGSNVRHPPDTNTARVCDTFGRCMKRATCMPGVARTCRCRFGLICSSGIGIS